MKRYECAYNDAMKLLADRLEGVYQRQIDTLTQGRNWAQQRADYEAARANENATVATARADDIIRLTAELDRVKFELEIAEQRIEARRSWRCE